MSSFIEMRASKKSLAFRKFIHGVGINDSSYMVSLIINGKTVHCPFYQVWWGMLGRCYSKKFQEKNPTYIGCTIAPEWLLFSNFKKWMEKQDWKLKEIDKDILIVGNKIYSPSTCIFVSSQVNSLLTNSAASRGQYPQGVSFDKDSSKYRARCSVNGKNKHLGRFNTIKEAEYEYLTFKSNLIKRTASEEEAEENPKLRDALLCHANAFSGKAKKLLEDKS